MDAVKEYDAVLATGHLYPEESVLLCREGRARGVRMILTHPEFSRTKIPAPVQREMAELGVYIEKCWYNIAEHEVAATDMAAAIHTVGAEHCFLSTDRGQQGREAPAEGLRQFIAVLAENGVSRDQLWTMTHQVPQAVLNV